MSPRAAVLGLLLFSLALVAVLKPGAARASDWRWENQEAIELDSIYYPINIGDPTKQLFEQLHLEAKGTLRYKHSLKFHLAPKLVIDPLNPSSREKLWGDVPEGYAQFQAKGFSLQAGMNLFTWGVTDVFNPLDVVNAHQFFDPLRGEKMGAPSIQLKQALGPLVFEAVYLPIQQKSLLPGENSRWLPREVFSSRAVSDNTGTPADLILPSNVQYGYLDDLELDHALTNNYGGRLQGNGILEGLDLSAEYFEGAAPLPAIDPTVNLSIGPGDVYIPGVQIVAHVLPNIGLTPIYYRQRVYGGSLVYAGLGMIFRFEAAVTRQMSQDPGLPGDNEAYVGGLERSFNIGDNALIVLAQASYAHYAEASENSVASLSRIFDRAIMLGFRYPFSETFTVLVSGLADTNYQGRLARAEVDYGLSDTFKFTVAADGLWGPPDTPVGVYHNNKRVIAGLRASF